MMLKKGLLVLALLALFSATASAKVFDVNAAWYGTPNTYSSPNTTKTVYPNLYGSDQCIDFNVVVTDSNGLVAIHRLTLDFNVGTDRNQTFVSDYNLSSTNCTFVTENDWDAPNAQCKVNYCFATGTKIPNGTYTIDVNVWNVTLQGVKDYNAQAFLTLTVNNRYIDSATESMLNILPIVLAAVLMVVAIMGALGYVPGKAVLVVLPALVVVIIIILVFTQFLLVLKG